MTRGLYDRYECGAYGSGIYNDGLRKQVSATGELNPEGK